MVDILPISGWPAGSQAAGGTGVITQSGVSVKVTFGTMAYGTESDYALLAGRAGGQTLTGGTAADEDLRLTSTAHATKGTINIGNATQGFFWNETNSRMSIGADDQNITVNGSSLGIDLAIHNDEAGEVCQTVFRYATSATRGACWFGARSRGNIGAETIVQSGDRLVTIQALGYDGVDYEVAAQMLCEADGTPGNNDMPGRWVFLTTPNGSATPIEAIRFSSDQTSQFSGAAQPLTNDLVALGSATVSWADLFLASGGVINWNNGNVTITHAAATLTVAGATTVSLGTSAAFTTGTIELGAASDTTVSRASAGDIAVEGNLIYRAGGTDVPVTDGGTGASTAAAAATNLGLGTGDSPQFTAVNIGAASDTTVSRSAAGVIAVEGVPLFSNIPQNSQSTAYTTVLADAQKHILHPTADNNARTFTIDSNANVAYPIGTAITFVNQINTVTIAITADTMTLAGAGTTGSRTLAANGIATALKIASTSWIISGQGLT